MELSTLDYTLIALGYLLGSLSSAIIVSKLMRLPDPRTQGSGNPGATNMLRVGGKKAAAITLAGDFFKGLLPVALAQAAGLPMAVIATVGLAALLGHLYPIFFDFRGGKGVATALGVLLAACWPAGLATIGTWLVVFALTRLSSLSALTAFLFAPTYVWWLHGDPNLIAVALIMTILLFWRHRSNIRKLLSGGEDRSRLR